MSPLLLALVLALPAPLLQVPPVGEGKWTGTSWCGVRGHKWVDNFKNCPICEAARSKPGGGSGPSSSGSSDVFAEAMAHGIVHGDAGTFAAGLGGAMMGGFLDSLFSGSSGPSAAEIAEMHRREEARREAVRREMERQRLVRVSKSREMRAGMERSDNERSERLEGIFDIVKPKKSSDYVGAWSDSAVAADEPWTDTSVVDLRPDHATRKRREELLRGGYADPDAVMLGGGVIDPSRIGGSAAEKQAAEDFARRIQSGTMPEREMSRSEAVQVMKDQLYKDLTGAAKDDLADRVGISDPLSIGEHIHETYVGSTLDRVGAAGRGDLRAMYGREDTPHVHPSADFTRDYIVNDVNSKVSSAIGLPTALPVNFSPSSIDSMVDRAKELKQGYYDPMKAYIVAPAYGPAPIKRP